MNSPKGTGNPMTASKGTGNPGTANTGTTTAPKKGIKDRQGTPRRPVTPPPSRLGPPPAPLPSYLQGPVTGPIGTLIHQIVLMVLVGRLGAVGGVTAFSEVPVPGAAKDVRSSGKGEVDLVVLLRDPAKPNRGEAQLYEVKPNNPENYRAYATEVDSYAEYFMREYGSPRTFKGTQVTRATRGQILTFLRAVQPMIFDPVVIQTTTVDVFVRFWPAATGDGPEAGLIVYDWGLEYKKPVPEAEAVALRMEALRKMLKVPLMNNPVAQYARYEFLASNTILLIFGVALVIAIGVATGYGAAAAAPVVVLAAATTVTAATSVAVPLGLTSIHGALISVSTSGLIVAGTKVANDVKPLVVELIKKLAA